MLKELTWDSALFKRKIGTLKITSKELPYLDDILRKAKIDGFRYITCRLKSQDTLLIKGLELSGFYLTDIGVTFAVETNMFSYGNALIQNEISLMSFPQAKRVGNPSFTERFRTSRNDRMRLTYVAKYKNSAPQKSVKTATHQDIPMLKKVIKGLFTESRFYSDPFFSKQKADKLYQAWIENSVKGEVADIVFHIPTTGFISCRKTGKHTGEIILVGIRKGYRGKGYGTMLTQAAMKWFQSQNVKSVTVRTQLKNSEAINFYLKQGLNFKGYDIMFGKIL
jgi:ribosomal protein S18 acetylase RimI-like enzyme